VLYTQNASPLCNVIYSLPGEYVAHGVVLADFALLYKHFQV